MICLLLFYYHQIKAKKCLEIIILQKKRIIKNTFQKDQNYNYNISNNYSVQENNNDNNRKIF